MSGVSVLIVSAHSLFDDVIGEVVRSHGYSPVFAAEGEPAAAALARLAPRLVLLDCTPGARCLDPELLAAARHAGVKVVLFSPALHNEDVEQLAGQYGARWLALPLSSESLRRILSVRTPPEGSPVVA